MLFDALLAILAFLAVMLVAGNNLSACVGPAVGARIVTKRAGALLGAIGFSVGLLVQGSGMVRSVAILLPKLNGAFHAEALVVAILVFIIADLARVPMSLSMSLFGLLAGISVAHINAANSMFLVEVFATWFVAPAVAALLAFYIIRAINKREAKNIWQRIRFYKVLLLVLSFTTAYVLGANTLGLVVATAGVNIVTVAVAIGAIFVGCLFLSSGAIRRVSQEFYLMRYSNATVTLVASTILVELATIFNIPLSNTQATAAAVFGTGMSYRTKFMSLKPFLTIVAGWIIAPLLSFTIGLLL